MSDLVKLNYKQIRVIEQVQEFCIRLMMEEITSHIVGLNTKCGYCGEILAVVIQEEIFRHNCFKHYNEKIHTVSIDDDFVVTIVPNSNEIISKDTGDEHQQITAMRC